jgi:hypothetical protein
MGILDDLDESENFSEGKKSQRIVYGTIHLYDILQTVIL